MTDLTHARWRRSRASQQNGQCVELALLTTGLAVRDSKSPDTGILVIPQHGTAAFITAIKAGRLDG